MNTTVTLFAMAGGLNGRSNKLLARLETPTTWNAGLSRRLQGELEAIMVFAKEWLKVIVLILLPINAWLGIFCYLRWQSRIALHQARLAGHKESTAVRFAYFQRRLGIKEGQRLQYPFPYPTTLLGSPPPVGRGVPVLFLNTAWIAASEVWQPVIQEVLNSSPSLHLVLLSYSSPYEAEFQEMMRKISHSRVSALVGDWVFKVFGNEVGGILLVFCDSNGVVQAVEPYPELKHVPSWEKELEDWRPKLHQAVKKVLDKFFPKGQGRR